MSALRKWFENHRELVSYVFFGGLTTVVNYLVYFPLYNLLMLDAAVSNIIAWAVSVAFAFFTNKQFVFQSKCWKRLVVWKEAVSFVSSRLLSGGIETGLLFVLVTLMKLDGNLWKILVSVIVVVLNYVFSKLFVFRS